MERARIHKTLGPQGIIVDASCLETQEKSRASGPSKASTSTHSPISLHVFRPESIRGSNGRPEADRNTRPTFMTRRTQ